MNLNDFIINFSEQFEDTDSSEITATTKFHELDEWSSLLGMSILALAKATYGKSISGSELRNCETVEDVFNLIKNK